MSLTSTPGLNLSTSINNFVHFRSADGRSGRGNILRHVKREGELSRGELSGAIRPGKYVRGKYLDPEDIGALCEYHSFVCHE